MPGYSGTPLAKKLGIKDDFRAALLHTPDDVKPELCDALEKCRIQTFSRQISRDLDFIFLFAKSRAGLELELLPAAKALAPAGMLWISWPKKSSGVATDLTENVVRQSGLDAGLVDVKVCAVTDVWSGLKFVIPVKNRPKKQAYGQSPSAVPASTARRRFRLFILVVYPSAAIMLGLRPAGQPRAAVPAFGVARLKNSSRHTHRAT